MKQLRDDLVMSGAVFRGLRYLAKGDENSGLIERVCLDYVDRKDICTTRRGPGKEVNSGGASGPG